MPGASSTVDFSASADESETYYVQAVFDSLGVEVVKESNRISTINPVVNGFGNSTFIKWYRPTENADSTLYLDFEVQMNYTGVWETVINLAYSDTSAEYFSQICPVFPDTEVDIDFRVIIPDVFGCTSISVLRDDVDPMYDTNPPTPPVIETVTVDTVNQKATIYWFPAPEGDVEGYRVLYEDEVPVGIPTTDPSVHSLIDPSSNWTINSLCYVVIARDTCGGNETSSDDCIPHCTMRLDIDYFKCDQSAFIEWNEYENWEGGVNYYVIYGGLSGGPKLPLDTLPATITSFLHQEVPLGVSYQYMVKAVPVLDFRPSTSGLTGIVTDYPDTPDISYLANVSVTASKQIELKALIDPAAVGTRYRLERLNRFGDAYITKGFLPQELADADGYLTWYDSDAFPSSTVHTYRVVTVDSCGVDGLVSNDGNNILSSVIVDSDARANRISWTPYSNWQGTVLGYNVYLVEGPPPGTLLAALPSGVYSFEHEVDSLLDYVDNAQYCYRVEAVEGLNAIGLNQVAYSNITCGTQEPIMYIPTAFTPNGDEINDFFMPIGGYFDRNNGYSMTIYDRWGHVIFETDDYYKPWRAEDGDGVVQEGVYTYQIRFRTGGGEVHQRVGNITVLLAATE